jgi:hypothetical protein
MAKLRAYPRATRKRARDFAAREKIFSLAESHRSRVHNVGDVLLRVCNTVHFGKQP